MRNPQRVLKSNKNTERDHVGWFFSPPYPPCTLFLISLIARLLCSPAMSRNAHIGFEDVRIFLFYVFPYSVLTLVYQEAQRRREVARFIDNSAKEDEEDEYEEDDPAAADEPELDWTDQWDDLAEEMDEAAKEGKDTSTMVVASLRNQYNSANNPRLFQDIIAREEQRFANQLTASPPTPQSPVPSPASILDTSNTDSRPSIPSSALPVRSMSQSTSASAEPLHAASAGIISSLPDANEEEGDDAGLPMVLRRQFAQHPDQEFLLRYPIYQVRCWVCIFIYLKSNSSHIDYGVTAWSRRSHLQHHSKGHSQRVQRRRDLSHPHQSSSHSCGISVPASWCHILAGRVYVGCKCRTGYVSALDRRFCL